MAKTWREIETEQFAKLLKINQNTSECPKCGLNIDIDIAPLDNGIAICRDCFLDTEEKKMAHLFGYVQELVEQHAKEFNRDVSEVKHDLLTGALKKK
jgi:hypothetical protein